MFTRAATLAGIGCVGFPLLVVLLANSVPVDVLETLPSGAKVTVTVTLYAFTLLSLISWVVAFIGLLFGNKFDE